MLLLLRMLFFPPFPANEHLGQREPTLSISVSCIPVGMAVLARPLHAVPIDPVPVTVPGSLLL